MNTATIQVGEHQSLASKPLRRQHRRLEPRSILATATLTCTGAIITILLATSAIITISCLIFQTLPSPAFQAPVEVLPLQCHSHNDYWRKKPLFSALDAGCVGLEADVWPYEDDLYVAHTRGSMQSGRTLKSLYIDPLTVLLRDAVSGSAELSVPSFTSVRGLYRADPSQTMVLLIDIKSNAHLAWPILVKQLDSLRRHGWLSTWKDGQLASAPITIVLTGKALFTSKVFENFDGPAFGLFLDAPLLGLDSDLYHRNNSYWASVSFRKSVGLDWFGRFGTKQLELVRRQIQNAHDRGLKVRYWGLPSWPATFRNQVWESLVAEGLDVFNVDDLKGFAEFWRKRQDAQLPTGH